MISSAYYDNLDKAKKKATLKMTDEEKKTTPEEKKTTPEDFANLSLAIQEASTAMIEFKCLTRIGTHSNALEPLNRAVRNVREANRLLDEMGVK